MLNSDDAVVSLMIHNFSLPQDLYYWNSNRFGSLIPLIGQIFYKIFGLSPVLSESISHYLLLVGGFLGFASLFKSKISKIAFAIVWFLPPLRMIDILKLSQGEQYALIGIAIYFINILAKQNNTNSSLKKHLYLILITIALITSVWVSDLAIISISVILTYFVFKLLKTNTLKSFRNSYKRIEFYYIFIGSALGVLFIYYAKENTTIIGNYYDFFEPNVVYESFKIFILSMVDLFTFSGKEFFTSLYLYLLLVPFVISIINHKNIKIPKSQAVWITILAIDLALTFIVIISSKWALLNGIPRRYFVCNYISLWVIFLIVIENIKVKNVKIGLLYFIILTTTIGGYGTIYNFKDVDPNFYKSFKKAKEIMKLGEIGIISGYWNSYIYSIADPDNIKATPHDKSSVRNQRLVDSVFSQPKLYLIRDGWIDSFPDTLVQFGYVIVKNGDEFRLGGCNICSYRKIKLNKKLGINNLKTNTSEIITDSKLGKKVFYVSADSGIYQNSFFVFGPYMPLGIGSFKVNFYIKAIPKNEELIGSFQVTSDWGNNLLVSKKLSNMDLTSKDGYEYIILEFDTKKRHRDVEFRIYYTGNADLYFEHLRIIEN